MAIEINGTEKREVEIAGTFPDDIDIAIKYIAPGEALVEMLRRSCSDLRVAIDDISIQVDVAEVTGMFCNGYVAGDLTHCNSMFAGRTDKVGSYQAVQQ